MTTPIFLDEKLCINISRCIVSFLSTNEYGILNAISKYMTQHFGNELYLVTLNKYNVSSQDYLDRILYHPHLFRHLKKLKLNCKRIELSFSTPIIFENVETLEFYTDYNIWNYECDWKHLFTFLKFPKLVELNWRNIDFPFIEMIDILKDNNLLSQIQIINLSCHYFCHTIPEPVLTDNVVYFYRHFPSLTKLTLDFMGKECDRLYKPIFETKNDFRNLKYLKLVNRSKSLIQHICGNQHLLPSLESLEILWIFDSYVFLEYKREDDFTMLISKNKLKHLRLSYTYWKPKLELLPEFNLCLYSNEVVCIKCENFTIRCIECPNGYKIDCE